MNYDQILTIIADILGALIAGLIAVVLPKAKAYVEQKIGIEKTQNLLELVNTFVESAEQMYAKEDKDGSIRKQYVMTRLQELGFEITEATLGMIESKVYELNNAEKALKK